MNAFPYPVEAVIFDMDGLLLDTESVYRSAMVAAASAMGYDFPGDFCQSMVGTAEAEIHLILRRRFGADFPVARLFADCEAEMRRRLDPGVPVKTGAVELIGELAARKLPMAVATSTARRIAEQHLSRAGLLEHFAAVCTREDVMRGKPYPDIFVAAAGRLGVHPERCVVLEDSYPGVRAAHASGAMAIMVPDMLPATDELRALCVAVVRDLNDVRAMLQKT
ncbi:MAG: HAD family phosphatase [Xanthobacteraceae bacterium]|nr:HAD family phosphatase [Xanthobacteraceae bacterium]